jgi:hypothetical protein
MDSDSISGPATRYRILTVGDGGDLTLSLALTRAYRNGKLDLVASTLMSSKEELVQTYLNAVDVLRELEERNVPVFIWCRCDESKQRRTMGRHSLSSSAFGKFHQGRTSSCASPLCFIGALLFLCQNLVCDQVVLYMSVCVDVSRRLGA